MRVHRGPGVDPRVPAVLLVVLAALASLLGGVPAATPGAPDALRRVVGAVPVPAVRPPAAVRPRAVRETRNRATTRMSGDRGLATIAHSPASASRAAGSGPSPVVPGVLVLLALVLVGRAPAGHVGWSLPGRTPAGRRGRAPPAYALV